MRSQNAYFTVEAALVLPFVMGVLIMVIFLFLFQYDRCLLEQDVNRITIYAASETAASMEKLQEKIERKTATFTQEKYVAWDMEEFQLVLEKSCVEVKGSGSFRLPLPEWNVFSTQDNWTAGITRKSIRVSPEDFIRLYQRITGGE